MPTVHHLNCAPMRPLGGSPLVAHCLLVETDDGLLLVDTGLGTEDVTNPHRLGAFFRRSMRPSLDLTLTAAHRIRALGHDPGDVRDVVVTHLDLDHAGGLSDFPEARVHVRGDEFRAATRRATPLEAGRYLPVQWAHGPRWILHETADADWYGFAASPVRRLPDVLLVPLPGHTRGHCGVAVRTTDGWLLHAGDAYFFHGETDPREPRCPRMTAFHQRLVAQDHAQRAAQVARLRKLRRTAPERVRVFSAHDTHEFADLAASRVHASSAS
ncbi:MBL fold metallo-hydrolase [Streptomyces sp. NPDC057638]|uniref:MBL fold metallo-hydrolase n=1 Tax=Streptomyces sp. NPDC057638 TaxID=3346190 RepID=UPI0036B2AFE9